MFVYIFSRIFDTCLSLYMKGYYISTTTFIAREIREISRHTFKCSKTSPPPKSLNHPYAGYTYLYFKYFSVRGELKRIHKSMLNNSDIKTRNSELYIILYIKVQRSPHIAYDILYYTTANCRRKTNSLLIPAGCCSL
jgi:hypothetical protein